MTKALVIGQAEARRLCLRAQRLDRDEPFGSGPAAVARAVAHLGYVQIDTINVIERSHHHILQTRIPGYRREDLAAAQSADRTIFEYWTHALAYVPTADYRFFVPAMERRRAKPHPSFAAISPADYTALLARIHDEGPLSIRDIDDEVLVEKTHAWGSRKPSKRLLAYGFLSGDLTILAREGMVKTYDLTDRHFAWAARPEPVGAAEFAAYFLDRGLRSQGLVSLESVTYGTASAKPEVARIMAERVETGALVPVIIDSLPRALHWAEPAALDELASLEPARHVHILSPFDPLVIQRKRLAALFGYEHRFEAYVPADKRLLGYFALPVLVGDRFVAAIDFRMDRARNALEIRRWTWFERETKTLRRRIDSALARFERFQKGD